MTTQLESIMAHENQLAEHIVTSMIQKGIQECCVAAGSRNAPLVYALNRTKQIKVYEWSEERSAAFFALGRIKATQRPVAVIVTSGAAAGELLPATMNAYYFGLPLLLVTADRPRRFRGTGAPQTAEQVNLFGCYVHFEQDIAQTETCDLEKWTCQGPGHLNVCFEEPKEAYCQKIRLEENIPVNWKRHTKPVLDIHLEQLTNFLRETQYPLVVLGGIKPECKEAAISFLLKLRAPIYAEATSNLREEPRLAPLCIRSIDRMWQTAEKYHYPLDGILRVGEVPTARIWRDLEDKEGKIKVCSISEQPFSGLSWAGVVHTDLTDFFSAAAQHSFKKKYAFESWYEADRLFGQKLLDLYQEEPTAEPSLVHAFSCQLARNSQVYLGNSLPIRQWDLSATFKDNQFIAQASRGLNGIDGQLSTFFGLCQSHRDNWAILGDLTVLYDLAGPWILKQLAEMSIHIAIINNKGGQIFSKMYSHPAFINAHQLQFKAFADFWSLPYERWERIPADLSVTHPHRLIEICPDANSTQNFWKKMAQL